MTVDAPLPGNDQYLALTARLEDINLEIESQRELLKSINDASLRGICAPLEQILDLGTRLMTKYTRGAGADIAEELAGLLSLTRAVKVPLRDPAREKSFNLDQLRGAQGRMVMAVSDPLDVARSLGLVPPEPALPGGLPAEIATGGNEDVLQEIAANLDRVADQLDALEAAKGEPSSIRQAQELIEFYVGAMRIQIDLARLQLVVSEQNIDFAALSRVSQTMADLTGDFFATISAWADRVVSRVSEAARSLNRAVGLVSKVMGRAIRTLLARRSRAPSGLSDAGRQESDEQQVTSALSADLNDANTRDTPLPDLQLTLPSERPSIFISYSSSDRPAVERLVHDLERSGIKAWWVGQSIPVGASLAEWTAEKIRSSRFFIACRSGSYEGSWQDNEIRFAIDASTSSPWGRPLLVPVLLDEPDPQQGTGAMGMLLSGFPAVRLYENWTEGVNSLAHIISSDDTTLYRISPERRSDLIKIDPISRNDNAEMVVHLDMIGDVNGRFGGWIGDRYAIEMLPGSGGDVIEDPAESGVRLERLLWIEGFLLAPNWTLSNDDISYQVIMPNPRTGAPLSSVPCSGGNYCGSRGVWQAIRGLCIRLSSRAARQYRLSYSVIFSDGSRIGPVPSGTDCMTKDLHPVVAMQVVLQTISE